MANVIYRGPIEREPQTINLPVAGAYLPGLFVVSDGSELTLAVAADAESRVMLLSNRRFYGQDITTAYESGETGVAYRIRPDDEHQARMAAGTYNYGDPLTIDANSRLAAAGTDTVVVAYFDQETATLSAGDFADIVIADSHRTASA